MNYLAGRLSFFLRLRYLPQILTKKEKFIFGILVVLFISSSLFLARVLYFNLTEIQPAFGGTYAEGVVGQPQFLNPIYSQASDVDRDLVELLFAGLMKYDKDGKIVGDLAEGYTVNADGTEYEFALKKNAFWHDGKPISADDVLFTIKIIQDGAYQSQLYPNWLGITVEKKSDNIISFRLKKPYAPFLELATIKIIPKHIWENVNPESFPFSSYNLMQVIGSGPYELKNISRNKSGKIEWIELKANSAYFGKKPFIKTVKFYFFDSEQELILAAKTGLIDGFAPSLAKNYILNNFKSYHFIFPRYFAVFFNWKKSPILAEKKIREGLSYGFNPEEIIKRVFQGNAVPVSSPVLTDVFGLKEPEPAFKLDKELAKELFNEVGFKLNPESGLREKKSTKKPAFQFKSDLQLGSKGKEVEELQKCLAQDPKIYPDQTISGYFGEKTKTAVIAFQEKYAQEILKPAGLTKGNGKVGPATREKLNQICFPKTEETTPLAITLTTTKESPLIDIAKILQEQWKEIGVNVEIKEIPTQDLPRDVIRSREYEALLFGQVLGTIPDPFPFWHSSQIRDPGLNLTSFESKEADAKLISIREAQEEDKRKEMLEDFQNILLKEYPAVFLARPDYLYFISPKIKGVEEHLISDPSKRFIGIENWYLKTRRVFK